MTEQELREGVVTQAESWLGCCEADGSHREIIDLYNSHMPLARGYAVRYTDHWCATFVSAVAIKMELTAIIPTECSCEKQIALFREMGCWQEADGIVPRMGDIIYYDWNDSGTGDNTGHSDHVGIVKAVHGRTITVVEGNRNEAVQYRTIAVDGRYIRGYGQPNYSSLETVEHKPSAWAEGAWQKAVEKGILDGTRPQDGVTREELAVVLERIGCI